VQAPSNSGYGRSVITELVPYELGGTARLAFSNEGVQCLIELPAKWLAPVANGETVLPQTDASVGGHRSFEARAWC